MYVYKVDEKITDRYQKRVFILVIILSKLKNFYWSVRLYHSSRSNVTHNNYLFSSNLLLDGGKFNNYIFYLPA